MAEHITRCPHCQTTFRVRAQQLSAASGMVRCGSCLQIFKAADFFIKSTAAPEKAKTSATTKKEQDIPSDALIDDNFLIHDDMEADDDETVLKADEEFSFIDDPSADYNLRAPEKLSRPQPRDNATDFGEIILDIDTQSPFGSFAEEQNPSTNYTEEDRWADALLDELDQAPASKPKAFKAHIKAEPDEYFEDFGQLDIEPITRPESLIVGNITPSPFAAKTVASLQDEPLEIHENAKRKLPWLWALGSLLLLALGAAQFLYFNFSELSRTPTWRPTYTSICQLLDCQLPKIQDTKKMASQLFTVKTHPHYQGALLVETLLLNKASYSQPFPDILLTFKDLNEKPIASRRFTPEQYLSGEMAGIHDMPEKAPVHIALEIVDPGAEAVSFTINLLANH